MFNYYLSIIFFISVKWFYSSRITKSLWINKIASITFGIYLLDPILKILLYRQYTSLVANTTTIIMSIGWIAISLLVGGFITYLLRKITFMRKIL